MGGIRSRAVSKARFLFANGRVKTLLHVAGEGADRVEGKAGLMRKLAGILRDCQQAESEHEWLEKALDVAPGNPGTTRR